MNTEEKNDFINLIFKAKLDYVKKDGSNFQILIVIFLFK